MPATPRDISGESEEEKRRRVRIFLMLRRKELEGEKKPLQRSLSQAEQLNKTREERRERRRSGKAE